jgi:hypothetical protein
MKFRPAAPGAVSSKRRGVIAAPTRWAFTDIGDPSVDMRAEHAPEMGQPGLYIGYNSRKIGRACVDKGYRIA